MSAAVGESDDSTVGPAQPQIPKSRLRSRRFLSIAATILIAGTPIGYRSIHDTRALPRQGRDIEFDLLSTRVNEFGEAKVM